MQMINALVKTQHKKLHKHHMQFLTSAPNFRGKLTPSPRPGLSEPRTSCEVYWDNKRRQNNKRVYEEFFLK